MAVKTDKESRDRAEFEQWFEREWPKLTSAELRRFTQNCYVLLESLRVSVKWELAPEIEKTIAELVARAEALLERGKE